MSIVTTVFHCGCRSSFFRDSGAMDLVHCPKHEATDDLLAACKEVMATDVNYLNLNSARLLQRVIAKAEGRTS